jgi:hypothetical protein
MSKSCRLYHASESASGFNQHGLIFVRGLSPKPRVCEAIDGLSVAFPSREGEPSNFSVQGFLWSKASCRDFPGLAKWMWRVCSYPHGNPQHLSKLEEKLLARRLPEQYSDIQQLRQGLAVLTTDPFDSFSISPSLAPTLAGYFIFFARVYGPVSKALSGASLVAPPAALTMSYIFFNDAISAGSKLAM